MSLGKKCQELCKAIETSTGERSVHRELETVPWVMLRLFERCYGGYVISHFAFGDEFEADFVVLTAISGGWDIHFLELEPPSLSPFNKAGDYSPRMNHAAGQIRLWKLFVERPEKKPYLISQVARAAQTRELVYRDGRVPTCRAGWRFDDPRALHGFDFHVLMGRRRHLDDDLMARKAGLAMTDGFELITYDRVLEWADIIDNDPTYR
jgi:Domain of unknown function (DUF4263)